MLRRTNSPARHLAAVIAAPAAILIIASASVAAGAGDTRTTFSKYRPDRTAQIAPQPGMGGALDNGFPSGGQPSDRGLSGGTDGASPLSGFPPSTIGGMQGDASKVSGGMQQGEKSPLSGNEMAKQGNGLDPGANTPRPPKDDDPSAEAIDRLKDEAKIDARKVALKKAGKPGAKGPVRLKELHPLAAALPGMDVIVCEAGCPSVNEQPQVTYVQPTTLKDASSTAELKPAAGSAADPSKEMIECLAGCYDTPRSYPTAAATASAVASGGHWTATVTPTNSSAQPTSGDWMRRIDNSRGDSAGPK
ncbi:MAG: hypothetical protein KDJ47_02060 [Hyphomicrobiaceae bacterium]|nr:hypothetical protein [Hyphomicrobiaceae bacterium]